MQHATDYKCTMAVIPLVWEGNSLSGINFNLPNTSSKLITTRLQLSVSLVCIVCTV